MRFSIRDLGISTALLSVYLTVLTRLWRELFSRGQDMALFGAGLVMAIVLVHLAGDELKYRMNSGRRLRIYRPQNWWWHYAIAAPVVAIGAAAIVVPFDGTWIMMSLYLVLSAFSVHLFVCLTPLVSFTTNGVAVGQKKWAWNQRRIRLLQEGPAVRLQIANDTPIPLPADRLEQVHAILDEWLPETHDEPATPQETANADAIPDC